MRFGQYQLPVLRTDGLGYPSSELPFAELRFVKIQSEGTYTIARRLLREIRDGRRINPSR